MSDSTEPLEPLERIARQLEIMNGHLNQIKTDLHGCNEALHGQWDCCLGGNNANELLLEVSMLNYNLMPDERWRIYLQRKQEQS